MIGSWSPAHSSQHVHNHRPFLSMPCTNSGEQAACLSLTSLHANLLSTQTGTIYSAPVPYQMPQDAIYTSSITFSSPNQDDISSDTGDNLVHSNKESIWAFQFLDFQSSCRFDWLVHYFSSQKSTLKTCFSTVSRVPARPFACGLRSECRSMAGFWG